MTEVKATSVVTVTISAERYNDLLKERAILNALYTEGVANWEGYDRAMKHWQDNTDNAKNTDNK